MRNILLLSFAALTATSQAAWSTFHGNNQRNGLTSVVGPARPKVKWTFDIGGPVICSPVIAPDGSIVVGTTWGETKKPTLAVTAVKPDGTLKWRFELPWYEDETLATPAIAADGKVFVGTANGLFLCLDANGSEVWRFQAAQAVRSHVLVGSDGNVYVNLDGQLTSFTPTGTLRWRQPIGTNLEGGPTETLSGTIVVVGDQGVTCFSTSGSQLWNAPISGTGAPVAVSPNGDVIVGGGSVVALNAATGAVKWNSGIFAYGTYLSPTTDAQGNVYYGFDYNVYKISATGNVLSHQYLQDPNSNYLGSTYCSPLLDGAGHLYWNMGTGKRWAIPFEKAMTVFNTNLAITSQTPLPEATYTSNPAIADDGTLYIGCLDGKLYAFGP